MSQNISPGQDSEATSLETQLELGTVRPIRIWYERLLLFVAGAGFGGFFFGGILRTMLSHPKRPVFPEPMLGYTHLFEAKYGAVYGTFFEYLAVTYGFWVMWVVGVVIVVLFRNTKPKSRVYPRYPWQIFAGVGISMVLYYAIWRVSIDLAPP